MTDRAEETRTTRTERPAIRPYAGLEDLQDLMEQLRLQLDGYGDAALDQTLYAEAGYLEHGGLRLRLDWDSDAVPAAISKAGLDVEDVDLALVVDPKLLGRRQVVARHALDDILDEDALVIVGHNQPRPDQLLSIHNGYDLSAHLVLNADRTGSATSPRHVGTILAEVLFRVRVVADAGGLTPHPLSRETKRELNLHKDTLLFLEPQGADLLEAMNLDDSLKLLVDDRLLGLIAASPTQTSQLTQRLLLGLVLTQIAALTAIDLAGTEVDDVEAEVDGMTIVILRLLETMAKGSRLKTDGGKAVAEEHADLLELLKESPERVFSAITAYVGITPQLMDFLGGDEEEVD